MKNITIELNDLSFALLDTVTDDPAAWIKNAAEARATVAIAEQKASPLWMQAAMAVMNQGGDPMDDAVVFLTGRDLGIFGSNKTSGNLATPTS